MALDKIITYSTLTQSIAFFGALLDAHLETWKYTWGALAEGPLRKLWESSLSRNSLQGICQDSCLGGASVDFCQFISYTVSPYYNGVRLTFPSLTFHRPMIFTYNPLWGKLMDLAYRMPLTLRMLLLGSSPPIHGNWSWGIPPHEPNEPC